MHDDASPAEEHELRSDDLDDPVPTAGYSKLPVVGLGASAGGVEALQTFFEHAPADGGVAYVVVLHLSADHDSVLAEVLQRCTSMPVVQVLESQPMRPDTVFVIPPGKALHSMDGHLRVVPMRRDTARHVTVDLFFRTLAETHGPHAAAVVLSGMDGDGAIGIRRIKERGGLTAAQDPDEAQNSGMPRSAIATGMIDWVLPVAEMPARLLAYFRLERQMRLPPERGTQPAEPARTAIPVDEAALRDVLTYLRTRPGEAGALLQDLLISVTNFFRDPECFVGLEQELPRLFHGKAASDTVRIWVTACATGEEAYSVAMLVTEYARTLDAPPQIQIFATDLDDEALRTAREGLYLPAIEADVTEERLRRFFVREHRGYRVRRELREIVLFAVHDVLKDSPFSRVELVCCRNLLIYLTREAQQRVFDIFHFALQPSGLLFLGASESIDEANAKFNILDKKVRLFERRTAPRAVLPVPGGPSTLALAMEAQQAARAGPVVAGAAFSPHATLQRPPASLEGRAASWGELHFKLLEQLAPPSVVVDGEHEVLHMSPSAGQFMQVTGGEPTRNLLRLIRPELRIELRAALYQAGQHQANVRTPAVEIGDATGASNAIVMEVRPLGDLRTGLALVLLHAHAGLAAVQASGDRLPPGAAASHPLDSAAKHLDRELERLKSHLRDTVEQYEASTEELKSSNEELQAMNEELRSATEELETSREELQSINEELTTVNHELKAKIDELGHSNSDMQNLMDATAIATIFLDRELRVTRYTPSALALFNFIPSDMGRPLSDLTNQLDYPELHRDARQVLDRLVPAEREIRDASGNWYFVRALPYRTLDDHIAGVVFTFVDITEGKRGQEAQRSADERFAAVFNQASVGVVHASLDGTIVYSNRFHADLLGYTPEELAGKNLLELVHPDDQAQARELVATMVTQGRAFQATMRALRRDGALLWLHKSGTPLTDAQGQPNSLLVVSIDLTERHQVELALQRSEERLRLIVENARDYAIFSIDLDRRVTHWNAGAEHLLGYSESEMLGQRFDLLFTAEDRSAGVPEREVNCALRDGRAADDRLLVRKDGSRLWASGALMSMQGGTPGSAVQGFVKILRDQSDERRATEELEENRAQLMRAVEEKQRAVTALEAADAAKDRFLAVLAHELRNPLASIGAAAGVLQLGDAADGDRDKAVAMVHKQVETMKALLTDLLDVSLLRLDKLVLKLGHIDLLQVIDEVAAASRHALESAGHAFSVTLPDGPVMLDGDPLRLSQVLSNLLVNAIKYTPPGGRIELEAAVDAGFVTVAVKDNGIGMRPEAVESMFEMFTRGQVAAHKHQIAPGLGVGLALARSIVDLHGGSLTGRSDGPGLGSEFVMRLPLSADGRPAPAALPRDSAGPGRRLLVIDDNDEAAWSLGKVLRAAGHQVDVARTGEEGLKAAAALRPDVVILDVGLPDISGLEVARRIRAEPWGRAVLLVAATGWGAPQDQQETALAGFDAHLVKPIDLAELRQLIARPRRAG
jgi:two-component system, chemotaxis family, CheB/CheR fusion protein